MISFYGNIRKREFKSINVNRDAWVFVVVILTSTIP